MNQKNPVKVLPHGKTVHKQEGIGSNIVILWEWKKLVISNGVEKATQPAFKRQGKAILGRSAVVRQEVGHRKKASSAKVFYKFFGLDVKLWDRATPIPKSCIPAKIKAKGQIAQED